MAGPTLAERVLVHLAAYPLEPDAVDVPPEVTQEGIAAALDARAAHVSRALQGLLARGLVVAWLARPRGGRRRSRAHALTDAGRAAAKAAPAPSPAPVVARTTTVREDALAALEAALADALAGRARVVLVEGDAGSGKTRLLDAFRSVAAQRGARVLAGRGASAAGPQVLGPLHGALASVGVDARFRGLAAGTTEERALGAAAQALAAAARERPVALLLDDVHLAGPPMVRLLGGVLRLVGPAAPLLVVATFRREEAWELPNGPLYTALAPLARPPAGRLLALEGLGRASVARLLAEAGTTLDDDLLDRVVRESGGNPLFALAMAEAFTDGVDEDDFFPGVVAATVKERLSSLAAAEIGVLQCAAVCGAEFDYALLARAWDGGEDALLQALDVLLDRLLIEEVPATEGLRFRFEHPKVRDAALADLSVVRRRWWSERVAAAARGPGEA